MPRHFFQQKELEFTWQIFERYGKPDRPWTVEANSTGRVILTADEDNIKAMLSSINDFGKGERFFEMHKEFLGHGIISVDGDAWRASRALLRPHFVKTRRRDLEAVERQTDILLPLLDGLVCIDELFGRYTIDVMTDFMFGRSFESLTSPSADFMRSFDQVQHTQGLIERTGRLAKFIPRKAFRSGLDELNSVLMSYIDEALARHTERIENPTAEKEEELNFLDSIVVQSQDKTVLRDQLITVLLAGRDTAAVTLTWLFYELGRRPDVVCKLREEIDSVVGLHPSNSPTREELKSMRYLQDTINETLRLYPSIPTNARFALRDTTLPRGGGPDGSLPISVPKNTPIVYSTLALHRRADLYPPSDQPHHLLFAPERWQSWKPRPGTFIPFNAGPRVCIGQQFAVMEIAYTVVKILQTYDRIQYCGGEGEMMFQTGFALKPARRIELRFHRGGIDG